MNQIINIFKIVDKSIYSVQFDGKDQDEFQSLFALWSNPLYLEEFFEQHKSDLQSDFWGNVSVEEAVIRTRKEAITLEKRLIDIAELGKRDRYESLSNIFKPLVNNPLTTEQFERTKAKGNLKPSWLRIYAIRADLNLFVVSGGAIKLTPTMNEREHLLLEIQKLNATRTYLFDEENYDSSSFFELII